MLASGRPALDHGREALRAPIRRGSRAVLEFADLYFEVDPEVGGRIVAARVNGRDVLAGPDVHPENYGSTFWTSPQNGEHGWGWPPVVAVDSAPFHLREQGSGFELNGPVVRGEGGPAVEGLRVTKRFAPDIERRALHVEYVLQNDGARPLRLAPWEITRVAAGGLTFYAGPTAPTGDLPLEFSTEAGCYWFRHSGDWPPHGKVFGDGEGWVAHLSREGAMLVKTFRDLAPSEFAPGEAEIEIYASPQPTPAAAYVEVENQGSFSSIPAGESSSWSVVWYLRQLPVTVPQEPSQALVDWVLETIQ